MLKRFALVLLAFLFVAACRDSAAPAADQSIPVPDGSSREAQAPEDATSTGDMDGNSGSQTSSCANACRSEGLTCCTACRSGTAAPELDHGCGPAEACCGACEALLTAETRWVDDDGAAGWADCRGAAPLAGAAACSLATANTDASAGQTIYMRAGDYDDRIAPSSSGHASAPISFERYPGDPQWSVVVRGRYVAGECEYQTGLCLKTDHVRIVGVSFEQSGRWVEVLDGSDHNVIDRCRFYNAQTYTGVLVRPGARYTRITGSVFPDAPRGSTGCWPSHCNSLPYSDVGCRRSLADSDCSTCCWRETAPADMIRDHGQGTLIEENEIGNSSHNAITGRGQNGVIRSNVVHNRYHTAVSTDGTQYLIECNSLMDAGANHLENPSYRDRASINGGGLYISGKRAIARYNVVTNSDYGYNFGGKSSAQAFDQRAYHNTLYNNSAQIAFSASNTHLYAGNELKNNAVHTDATVVYSLVGGSCFVAPGAPVMVINCADSPVTGISNRFVNNSFTPGFDTFFFKDNRTTAKSLAQVQIEYPSEWDASNFTAAPMFHDPQNGDFALHAGSALIDAASWLTTVTGVSGKELQVADALYFYDGWGIPGETGDTLYNGDGDAARIVSVDYDAHTITVDNAASFRAGDPITTVSYSGSSPDVGAKERSAR